MWPTIGCSVRFGMYSELLLSNCCKFDKFAFFFWFSNFAGIVQIKEKYSGSIIRGEKSI